MNFQRSTVYIQQGYTEKPDPDVFKNVCSIAKAGSPPL